MKKTVAIILAAVLALTTFSGCTISSKPKNIEKLISTAIKLNKKLNDLEFSYATSQSYEAATLSYYQKSLSEVRLHNINNPKKYEMSETATISGSALSGETEYESYYKNGYYYTTKYGGSFKTKTNNNDNINIYNADSLVNISYSDMRSVGIKTESDGYEEKWGKGFTAITFTCKNSALKSFFMDNASSNIAESSDLSIKSGNGEYVINKEGYLVYQKLAVTVAVMVDGEELNSKFSNEISYSNIGKKVNPYNPEDSDYVEVKNLEYVIGISSAISKALSANDYIMDMTASADILQDDTRAGYERSYNRTQDITGKEIAQINITRYNKGMGTDSHSKTENSHYYTNGKYYLYSDTYYQQVYCNLDFETFASRIFPSASITPLHTYSTGFMKNISAKKTNGKTVYTFGLNTNTDDGLSFLNSVVSPYESFGGDFASADIKVNSFSGKLYVTELGELEKIIVNCNVSVKFTEGNVSFKYNQTINLSEINGAVKCSFPNFSKVNYEKIDKTELLSAYS